MNRRLAASTLSAALLAALCAAPSALAADPIEAVAPDPSGAQLAQIDQKLDVARDWMAVKIGTLTVAQFHALQAERRQEVRGGLSLHRGPDPEQGDTLVHRGLVS